MKNFVEKSLKIPEKSHEKNPLKKSLEKKSLKKSNEKIPGKIPEKTQQFNFKIVYLGPSGLGHFFFFLENTLEVLPIVNLMPTTTL